MSDFDTPLPQTSDKELENFLMIEKQKSEMNAQIHEFHGLCWDKCMGKPAPKLDGSTEMCFSNCVGRFLETSIFITQRIAEKLQSSGMLE